MSSILTASEIDILKAAHFDGTLRVHDGVILAVKTNVAFRGADHVRAFRALRAQGFLKWASHSVTGGELYDISEAGRTALQLDRSGK